MRISDWSSDVCSSDLLLFEDVKAAPEASVAIVSDHIGAPCHYSTQVGADPRNDSSERFLPLPVRTALAPMKEAVRPLSGNAVFGRVRGPIARQTARMDEGAGGKECVWQCRMGWRSYPLKNKKK